MLTYFKKTLKYLAIVISILAIIYFGAEAGYQVKYRLELWKDYRAMEKFNQSIIDMFKADTYGGKTPEETFNMFVEAIKNEDVDLAVKYIVLDPDRRENQRESLNKLKEEGKLKEYGEWFPAWSEMMQDKTDEDSLTVIFYWTQEKPETEMLPDGAGGFIETTFPAGKYKRSIDFVKSSNNIWKIENL